MASIKNLARSRWLPPLLAILLAVAIWQALVVVLAIPHYVLPTPSSVVRSLATRFPLLARHGSITLFETVVGFLLGSSAGMLLAVATVHSRLLERALYPLAVCTQTFPKEALAPLFLIWFGFGFLPKILISALICFFPVLVNGIRGLKSVDPLALDLLESLSASRLQVLLKLRLPCALPYLFSALKISVTLALIGSIIGEFVGASAGLGHLIMVANSEFAVDLLFAALVVLGLMGMALFGTVHVLEWKLLYWHESALPADQTGSALAPGSRH